MTGVAGDTHPVRQVSLHSEPNRDRVDVQKLVGDLGKSTFWCGSVEVGMGLECGCGGNFLV